MIKRNDGNAEEFLPFVQEEALFLTVPQRLPNSFHVYCCLVNFLDVALQRDVRDVTDEGVDPVEETRLVQYLKLEEFFHIAGMIRDGLLSLPNAKKL